MIKILNREDLSRSLRRKQLLSILEAGLNAVDLRKSTVEALKSLKGEIDRARRVFVVGFGKASKSMAEGCEDFLKNKIHEGLIISPVGTDITRLEKIRVIEGTHPIPSERNIKATEELLSTVSNLSKDDLVICLISGGGSALFVSPAEGISLEDKIRVTELLLKAGADVKELNTVRKHISAVKGGLFLRRLYPARVISLIASDVVGDPVEFIASGPTSADTTTFSDAKNIFIKYGLWDRLPKSVTKRITLGIEGKVEETVKHGDPVLERVKNIIIANNMRSLRAMEKEAIKLNFNAIILTSFLEGESREVGKVISSIMKQVLAHNTPVKKPAALILGGEATVVVKGEGKGGRNQELALSVLISSKDLKNFTFAAVGSDGVDGFTDAAGAIIDETTLERAYSLHLDPITHLNKNDSYNFFKPLNELIYTGLTGTNVNDLIVALIC